MFVLPSGLMVTKNTTMKKDSLKPRDLPAWQFIIIFIVIYYIVNQIEIV